MHEESYQVASILLTETIWCYSQAIAHLIGKILREKLLVVRILVLLLFQNRKHA